MYQMPTLLSKQSTKEHSYCKMKSKTSKSCQIQLSAIHSLHLLSIIFLLCQHGSVSANLSNQTDRLALLEFKNQIRSDPHKFFDSWNDSLHFCQWQGVKCGVRHQRVVGLNLRSQNINGTVSPHIGNLSFLRFINFQNNNFHGEIPQQIGKLFRLRTMLLNNNTFLGQLPVNLSHCLDLRTLYLSFNKLVAPIPEEFRSLKKLESLVLDSNYLTGFIPRSIGNLSFLTQLSISKNKFKGTIPNNLGQLTKLSFLNIGENQLSGTIPSSVYNISTITQFSVVFNNLTGTLPPNIGIALPNLRIFYVGGNNFYGEIPYSFPNPSQLHSLAIYNNKFTGQVPSNLGLLKNLQVLAACSNLLGSNSNNDLTFITSLSNCTNLQHLYLGINNFGGEIPSSVGNLSEKIVSLSLGHNHIAGAIPSVLENLVNLYDLWLENNILSGSIPSSLGKLVKLQDLTLQGNKLGGRIPSSLGNITWLYALDMSCNKLEGNIPETIGNCGKLSKLDLSQNNLNGSIPEKVVSIFSLSLFLNLSGNMLTGTLPAEVGKLKNINILDISNNKLTGNIPSMIGKCLSLEYLYIQGNFFHGVIPSALAALKGIRELDLSRNNLTGKIPNTVEKLLFLQYLNLSFNKLEGEVSKNGVFANASKVSVDGNSKLCGGIKELQLQPCRITPKKPKVPLAWKIVIIVFAGALLCVLITIIGILRRKARQRTEFGDLMVEKRTRISYNDLCRATEGFSPKNLIGSGGFGSVYQGKLNEQEGSLVAVKVLNLEISGASKSFVAECKALRNIRHRNLIKLVMYSSCIDSKRNHFKALVYELMPNGSLDKWIHPHVHERSSGLGLLQRVDIALDVANAIHYLHDQCEPPIVHCDLKPSNVLLDNELVAHVGDFGLARLLSKSVDIFAQALSSSMGIKGTIGYVAPEYGMGWEASKYGDVFSYGVLLLEMLTGIRPTDDMFKDGLTLHKYVRMALTHEDVMRIADPTLVNKSEMEIGDAVAEEERYYGEKMEKCIIGVIEIGVRCSTESPKERMSMNNVVRELHHIRTAFLSDRIIEN